MEAIDKDDEGTVARHVWEAKVTASQYGSKAREKLANDGGLSRWRRATERRDSRRVRRGMIRYVFVALDLSRSMLEGGDIDLQPSKCAVVSEMVSHFITQYFAENPISNLGLLCTRNGSAQCISGLSGNPKTHLGVLEESATDCAGVASIQNVLEMSAQLLSTVPQYGTKEVVLVFGSLSTCDPGDIAETIKKLRAEKVRVSVVHLQAELFVCKRVAEATGGTHLVVQGRESFRTHLESHVTPPPELVREMASRKMSGRLVRMGFPRRRETDVLSWGFQGATDRMSTAGYHCPRCDTKAMDLPTTCQVCSLPLVSSPQLARSYHHLFPLANFEELAAGGKSQADCEGCGEAFGEKDLRLRCKGCGSVFCWRCDEFMHDELRQCVVCL